MNPTPQRQRVVVFPTPNVNDLLFYELVDNHRVGETNVPEYGTKHPDTQKWPNHRLVHIKAADEQNKAWRYYYASDQLEQDDDNWEHTQADIGGTKFDAVARNYIIRRSEYNPEVPAQGSAMPDVPTSKFTGSYVLAERRQSPINDEVLNGLYVVERRVYVEKSTFINIRVGRFDPSVSQLYRDLYYRGEIVPDTATAVEDLFANPPESYWGTRVSTVGDSTNVIRREGQQLSTNWFLVEDRPVLSIDGFQNADGSFTVLDYYTTVNYTWPAVLDFVSDQPWERRDETVWRVFVPRFSKERYSGPCRARIQTFWRETAFSETELAVDQPPLPEGITVINPYFRINVPACLHDLYTYVFTNGTTDRDYKYTAYTYTFAATNFTDWASFVLSDTQKPSDGGYMREKVTIYPPDYTPPAP